MRCAMRLNLKLINSPELTLTKLCQTFWHFSKGNHITTEPII